MAEMAGENIPKCTAKDAKVRASVALALAVAPAMREAVTSGAALTLGCDHPHYSADVQVAPATVQSLAADLR